jgi:hypothetical protein
MVTLSAMAVTTALLGRSHCLALPFTYNTTRASFIAIVSTPGTHQGFHGSHPASANFNVDMAALINPPEMMVPLR